MYCIIGYICPNSLMMAMVYGLVWEGLELLFDAVRNAQARAAQQPLPRQIAKATDIVVNMCGFLTGCSTKFCLQ
jgi:hypothetical protein